MLKTLTSAIMLWNCGVALAADNVSAQKAPGCTGGCCWIDGSKICEKSAPEAASADFLLPSDKFEGFRAGIQSAQPNDKKM